MMAVSPEAARRRRIRLPVIGASLAGWLWLALASPAESIASFCSPGLWQALSNDRLAFVVSNLDAAQAVAWSFAMMIAMMLPVLLGPIGHVHSRSLPRRRPRAIALIVFGYLATWTLWLVPLFGLTVLAGLAAPASPVAPSIVIAFAVAAWQCSPVKQRALNRCHERPPLAAFGGRADMDVLRYGCRFASWCAVSCAPLMLLAHVAGQTQIWLIALVSGVIWAERLDSAEPPRWAIRWPRKALAYTRYSVARAIDPPRPGRGRATSAFPGHRTVPPARPAAMPHSR